MSLVLKYHWLSFEHGQYEYYRTLQQARLYKITFNKLLSNGQMDLWLVHVKY